MAVELEEVLFNFKEKLISPIPIPIIVPIFEVGNQFLIMDTSKFLMQQDWKAIKYVFLFMK
jgi:hypothetical protein